MTFWQALFFDLPKKRKSLFFVIFYHLTSSKYRVLKCYRLYKYFGSSKNIIFKVISIRLRMSMIRFGNCDIHLKSQIGRNFKLAHPLGVVIGAGVVIDDNVTVYQNVTLGSHGKGTSLAKEYPTVKKNVIIYPGSIVIGGVTIGENSVVGANSLINRDVPPNHIAYGNPMKLKQRNMFT
jgi:serine O-acetyltransferase